MRLPFWITSFLSFIFFVSSTAQTLFTYGGKPVSKAEFLQAFNKNPQEGDRKKAIEEYLPLYINYKLKVQNAYDKKMDSLPNQLAEVNNYKQQVVENFLNEQSAADLLTKEAFGYSQKDILLGHLFIAADAANPIASSTAAQQAAKAEAALKSGGAFADVVKQYSTDADRNITGGEVGWITAFNLPYRYEKAIYDLPVGGITEAIKGPTGWHFFKKIKERPAVGRVKLAQILIQPINKGETLAAKKTADSVYNLLLKGANFENLAAQLSDDRSSMGSGGVFPAFGVGTYDAAFESAAFELSKPGELSQPFETSFGWHILKLIEKTPVVSDTNNAENIATIKQQVLESGRTIGAKQNYLESQLTALQYKPAPGLNMNDLWRYSDSVLKNKPPAGLPINAKTTLFSFGKKTYTANDYTNFVTTDRANGTAAKNYETQFEAFKLATIESEWRANAPKLYPGIAAQVKEFKDANLLFEAMDKEVWSKAAEDNAGLEAYYKANSAKYTWTESVNAIIITADSTEMPNLQNAIKANPAKWRNPFENGVQNTGYMIDSNRFEINQLPDLTTTKMQPGQFTPTVTNAADGSQTSAYILKTIPAGGQRSFDDARGFVVNDYQAVLEKRWMDKLKKKYPVIVNDAVLKGL